MTRVVGSAKPVPVVGAILIGGESSRMGRTKALIELAGRPFWRRVYAALAEECDEVTLVGSADWAADAGVARIDDAPDTRGPLAGLLAVLRARPGTAVILAGCDLPLTSPAAVRWLVDQRRAGCLAVLPRLTSRAEAVQEDSAGVEPLLALYEPGALPLAETLAASDRRALHLLAGNAGVLCPTPPPDLRRCWTNVNSPADLAALSEIACDAAE